MVINESLAKGLKERLWNELDDLYDKNLHSGIHWRNKHKIKLGTRVGIQKIDRAFQIEFGQSMLAKAKFGSRNSPLMRYALLYSSQENVKEWEEKTFHILDLSVNAMGNLKAHATTIRIGEHAVSRVFQRHPEIYNSETGQFEVLQIIPEFQILAQLGQLMYSIIVLLKCEFQRSVENLSIPFVSKSGLFLGSYNTEKDLIDVRTFIADHQLGGKQDLLVNIIREHLVENNSPALPFFNHQLRREEGFPQELTNFYSSLSTIAKQFSELITLNEPNLEHKREYQKFIIKFLEYWSTSNDNNDGRIGRI